MDRHERLARLVEFVSDQGAVHVDEIVDSLGVSAATARRDLDALADQQLLTRTRGGAKANTISGEIPLRYRTATRSREKTAIARFAASLVRPGESVCFNGGTTTTAAAYELGVLAAADPRFRRSGLTVVTNAVNIANDLVVRPQVRVVVTGGVALTRSYELIGPLSERILPDITIDTLFLGVNAVDVARAGLYTHHEGEAAINGAFVRAARRTVVLADSSKVGVTAFARICALDDVDMIITDPGVDSALLATLRNRARPTITMTEEDHDARTSDHADRDGH